MNQNTNHDNPFAAPPSDVSPVEATSQPARRRTAWQGARFGACAALCIMTPLGLLGVIVTAVSPQARAQEWGTTAAVVQYIGGSLGGLALCAGLGAILGAVITAFENLRHISRTESSQDRP